MDGFRNHCVLNAEQVLIEQLIAIANTPPDDNACYEFSDGAAIPDAPVRGQDIDPNYQLSDARGEMNVRSPEEHLAGYHARPGRQPPY